MRRLIPGLIFAAFAFSLHAQQDFSQVQVKATRVAGTVYMLTGSGGNIGVSVGEDGIVLIDDQFAPLAPKIREALKGISGRPIKFVLNTHYHGDHTGGNEVFGREAPVIAHTNVRKRLHQGTSALGRQTPPASKGALPVVTFDSSLTVHINGEDVRAVHFPSGHTDGDSVIYFTQSNVVHMGDHFFNGLFPFVDLENGGSVSGMLANVRLVLATIPDDAKIIPGHGELGDKAALRRFAVMLEETTGVVQKALRGGQTLEQMKAAKILDPWATWGWSFISVDTWLETVHRELSAQ